MEAIAEARGDPARRPATSSPAAVGRPMLAASTHARAAAGRPFDQLQVARRRRGRCRRRATARSARSPVAARRLAITRSKRSSAPISLPTSISVASALEIFGGRLRRHAGGAQRPVKPVAGAAAHAQRPGVDRNRLLDQLQAAVAVANDLRGSSPSPARSATRSIGRLAPFLGAEHDGDGGPGRDRRRGRGDHRRGASPASP